MSRPRRTTQVRAGALIGVGSLLVGGGLLGLAPGSAVASSHREAPAITDLPKYDNTDVYAFTSPDDRNSVTIIGNWIPLEEPAGGPNFYPFATDDARYEFHIDNNGDAKADITYRYTFRNTRTPSPGDSLTGLGTFLYNNGQVTVGDGGLQDPNLLFRQAYTLETIDAKGKTKLITGSGAVAPSFVGDVSMPDYAGLRKEAVQKVKGVTTFAGQADDPFFLDLRVFDLLYGDQGTCNKEIGNDTLAGYNVNTIAFKVPAARLTAKSDPVIGVWSTTSRRNSSGKFVQVSRLGQPLVNEVVIPYQVKDTFNSIDPTSDGAALPFVVKPELASLLNAVCSQTAPTDNRDDLVTIFLTGIKGLNQPATVTPSEQLRLNTKPFARQKFNRLGVIAGDNNGFPNGRRLQDDVVDIALQVVDGVVAGTLGPDSGNADNPNKLGDNVDDNDVAFGNSFPYVGLPHSGSQERPAPVTNTGETLLTGGDGRSAHTGFPATQVLAVSLGGLVLLLGLVIAGRTRRELVPALG